jgi:hypothetical protein
MLAHEVKNEIERLSRIYGEAHIITMPHRQGLPDATIASWGNVVLEPLGKSDVDLLRRQTLASDRQRRSL